ncbi:MAG TPA: PilZ domain-containing protein [Kofleriaceae bacterium]|nr:PilZ domain-containing protein [Kofleriaceae bacterium]
MPSAVDPRRHARQQLVLKVEYDGPAGFCSDFLTDLSEGGLRINSRLEPGLRLALQLSFLGFVHPVQVEVEVVWVIPATRPGGPASGLAFIDPSPEARAWLAAILDHSVWPPAAPARATRIVLLETQPFLRDVYGQEVHNWAELRDNPVEPLDLVAFETSSPWLDGITAEPTRLGIVDVDEIEIEPLELYRRVRAAAVTRQLPLIAIGAPPNVAPFDGICDERLLCLRKPLQFGVLMTTVRMLVHDGE